MGTGQKVDLHFIFCPTWHSRATGALLSAGAESSGSPYYTASIPHLLQAESGTRGFAPTPNTQCRHTLHFSKNQKCPPFNVLKSITKTMLLSWFCITTANRSPQECQNDKNALKGLKPSSVIHNWVTLLCPSWKYPPSALLTCKTTVRLRASSQAFIWPTELSPIWATRLKKGGSTATFPLICWITDDHWTMAGYWGRKSTTCREAGEEAP